MTYAYPTAFSLWEDEERVAIARVLASGQLTMAGEVEAFEAEFAAWHGRRHAIMVNSGSSANLVAVAAIAATRARELGGWVRQPLEHDRATAIVPAIAWATTYAPLAQHGVSLLLTDVDDTWNAPAPYENDVYASRIIVACPVLGNPAHLAVWRAVANGTPGTYLVEDCCESLGARDENGRLAGTFGDLSTFSFFYSHQLSAIEGGMVLTDDDQIARLCRMLRNHGWTRGVDSPTRFEDEYDFRLMGYNLRSLELHAAVAREQLRKLPRFIAARRANLDLFVELTRNLPVVHQRMVGQPSPFGLAFTVASSEVRTRLVTALRASGVDCRLPTGGSFRQHVYAARWANQRTPAADRIHDTGIFLGNAPWDIAPLIEHAVRVMREVLFYHRYFSGGRWRNQS